MAQLREDQANALDLSTKQLLDALSEKATTIISAHDTQSDYLRNLHQDIKSRNEAEHEQTRHEIIN